MARTQRTPQKKLKAWDSSQRAKVNCPPKYACCGEIWIKICKWKGGRATGELVQCSAGAAAADWRALRAARRGARWQVSNEGLSLRPKGAAALLHRKGESRPSPSTQHDSNDKCGAHALRPKGAEALLHQKGEPRPTLNRQGYSRRGLTHRMEGSHATEGSQRLCCTERGAPSDAENSRRCDWWRDSHCVRRELRLCCTGGESPPCSLMQDAVWCIGRRAPITTEGSQRFCCTGSGSPVRHRARSATRNDRRRRHAATEGSRGSAAPEGEPRPTLNKQRDATDGGTLTAIRRELRLCCTGGESPPCGLMQGAVWRVGRRATITTEGSQRLCCTGSGSPVRHRARSATRNDRRRRHTATEGSRGSAAPEGEPRPTLNKQRDATDGGTLTASEGSCGSAAPEGRVPLAA